MRIAVIDLGTNTCNLLIAEITGSNYKILHQSKQAVKLNDDKISDNEISSVAINRTIEAFGRHKEVVDKMNIKIVYVIATSAVRTANNKAKFLSDLSESCNWLIKIISGEREAELIFKGVLLAFKKLTEATAILDIGGGSNETILAKGNEIIWKESRPAGMSRVINQFNFSDPIKNNEIKALQMHFAEQHNQAIEQWKNNNVSTLIGCSGAFDTIADIIDEVEPEAKQRTTQEIKIDDFYTVFNRILKTSREERIKIKGMDYMRTNLIVPAVILIDTLIRKANIKKIIQTDFALREGVLLEKIEKNCKNSPK